MPFEETESIVLENIHLLLTENSSFFQFPNYSTQCDIKSDDENMKLDSNISFSVLADTKAKITMVPTQYINSVPKSASHSASLYKPTENQINYLRTSGLSEKEINYILEQAFTEE